MSLKLLQILFVSVFLFVSLEGKIQDEPDYHDYAKMARFLVHKLDWTVMGTVSTFPEIQGFPMAEVMAYADSARGENSTGEIYMLFTDLHFPERDLLENNKLSLIFSMEQYKNCSDAMEPTCARLMITGSKKIVEEGTDEHEFAMNALKSRHPMIIKWILYPYHEFYVVKVNIEHLVIQDFYGQPNIVAVDDYYAADPDALSYRRIYRRLGRRRFFQRPTPPRKYKKFNS